MVESFSERVSQHGVEVADKLTIESFPLSNYTGVVGDGRPVDMNDGKLEGSQFDKGSLNTSIKWGVNFSDRAAG